MEAISDFHTKEDGKLNDIKGTKFRQIVGSLQYLTLTKLDIS